MKNYNDHRLLVERTEVNYYTDEYVQTLFADINGALKFYTKLYFSRPTVLRIVNLYLDPIIRNRTNLITIINHIYECSYKYIPHYPTSIGRERIHSIEVEIPKESWYCDILKSAGFTESCMFSTCLELNDDIIILKK